MLKEKDLKMLSNDMLVRLAVVTKVEMENKPSCFETGELLIKQTLLTAQLVQIEKLVKERGLGEIDYSQLKLN